MKALSIRQPWTWAILHGGKCIENRDWQTRVRGTIAIHASKRLDDKKPPWEGGLSAFGVLREFHGLTPPPDLPLGALVGTVELVDCVDDSDSDWYQGTYGFVLRNPVAFRHPVPWRGALGFFDVPDDVVRAALEGRAA